jgi:hypothetical protein
MSEPLSAFDAFGAFRAAAPAGQRYAPLWVLDENDEPAPLQVLDEDDAAAPLWVKR